MGGVGKYRRPDLILYISCMYSSEVFLREQECQTRRLVAGKVVLARGSRVIELGVNFKEHLCDVNLGEGGLLQ